MTKKEWAKKIKKQCEDAGTYKKFFDLVIDSLAGILEYRDKAEKDFKESGGEMMIEKTSTRGDAYYVKNPAFLMILDCENQALQFWKELGLTSKSWQAMMKEEFGSDKKDPMTEALKGIGL